MADKSSYSKHRFRIGIDLMGSDTAPDEIFDAVMKVGELCNLANFSLFVTKETKQKLTNRKIKTRSPSFSFVETGDPVLMHDLPGRAVLKKADSSLIQGVEHIGNKQLDAFISCGNTGALIAASSLKVKRLPGIERPALMALLPSVKGQMIVLDVGGNISCKCEQLVQFAFLGSAYYSSFFDGIPKVALLNNGVEKEKGTIEVKSAFRLLEELALKKGVPFTFLGNIEGKEVFSSEVDVLVTNGFVGNIFLKTAEGIADFILTLAEQKIGSQPAFVNLKPLVSELKTGLMKNSFPGALLAGCDGLIVKCHGNPSKNDLFSAILASYAYLEKELLSKMRSSLSKHEKSIPQSRIKV